MFEPRNVDPPLELTPSGDSQLHIRSSTTHSLLRSSCRILVLGALGGGKTYLSRALGRVLGLPVIHLDDHYWGPRWSRPTAHAWEERVRALVAEGAWVMDGNHLGSLPVRLGRAQFALYLDTPRWRSLLGAAEREARRLFTRSELPLAIRETGGPSSNGRVDFLRQVWRFRETMRPGTLALLRSSNVPYVMLRSRREARALLRWVDAP